jgi:hypothetical protein
LAGQLGVRLDEVASAAVPSLPAAEAQPTGVRAKIRAALRHVTMPLGAKPYSEVR